MGQARTIIRFFLASAPRRQRVNFQAVLTTIRATTGLLTADICLYVQLSCPVMEPGASTESVGHPEILRLEDAEDLAQRFRLLGDPGRLRMVYALLETGEMRVGDLAATVDATESATSHQLSQLRLAGLVRFRRQGREVYYRIADGHIRLILDVAVEHYLHDHEDRT